MSNSLLGTPDPLADLAQSLQPAIGVPPIANAATPTQDPVQPAPQPGGRLRSLLSNFFQGAGAAMMQHVGLPTPQEEAEKAFKNQLTVKQFESEQALRQAQIDGIKAEMQPVQLPGLPPIPAKHAGAVLTGLLNSQSRQAVATTANAPKLAALGLNPDGTPMDDSQLSPVQKTTMAQHQALTDVANARAELDRAGNDPSSPLFQQKLREFQAKMAVLNEGLGLRRQGLAQGQARIDALYGSGSSDEGARLTPAAQSALRESEPVHAQIKDLMSQFESMKNDNTPGKFFVDRLKYAAGMQSQIGQAADTIAQLELNKVSGAARVLRGSSKAYQALKMAMTHLPDVWKDSPALIYSKLGNLDTALEGIKHDAYVYGKKGGVVPPENGAPAGPPTGATHTGVSKIDGKKYYLDASGKKLGVAP